MKMLHLPHARQFFLTLKLNWLQLSPLFLALKKVRWLHSEVVGSAVALHQEGYKYDFHSFCREFHVLPVHAGFLYGSCMHVNLSGLSETTLMKKVITIW